MVGQPQVIVRAKHDPLLTVDGDDGVLGFRDRLEIGVEAGRLNLAGLGKLATLVEEHHLGLLRGVRLSRHGSSRSYGWNFEWDGA